MGDSLLVPGNILFSFGVFLKKTHVRHRPALYDFPPIASEILDTFVHFPQNLLNSQQGLKNPVLELLKYQHNSKFDNTGTSRYPDSGGPALWKTWGGSEPLPALRIWLIDVDFGSLEMLELSPDRFPPQLERS